MIRFKEYMLEDATSKQHDKAYKLAMSINKYAHRWGENPSRRMMNWVDEYNDMKDEMKKNGTWVEFCKKHNWSTSHNAYDLLA